MSALAIGGWIFTLALVSAINVAGIVNLSRRLARLEAWHSQGQEQQ